MCVCVCVCVCEGGEEGVLGLGCGFGDDKEVIVMMICLTK